MPTFRFTGLYQSHVQLPDVSVVLVDPGEELDLDFEDPGPLWEAVTPEKAPVKAPTPPTPVVPLPAPATPATPEGATS